jgi:hypothetical protein
MEPVRSCGCIFIQSLLVCVDCTVQNKKKKVKRDLVTNNIKRVTFSSLRKILYVQLTWNICCNIRKTQNKYAY